jgi:hypothetical protein
VRANSIKPYGTEQDGAGVLYLTYIQGKETLDKALTIWTEMIW